MPVTRNHVNQSSAIQSRSLQNVSSEDVKGEHSEEDMLPGEDEDDDDHNEPSGEVHIPRPPNCFILYRNFRILEAKMPITENTDNATDGKSVNFSKMISQLWKEEPESVKNEWRAKARAVKEEYERMYSDNRYTPQRRMAADDSQRRLRRPRKEPGISMAERVESSSTSERPSVTADLPQQQDLSVLSHGGSVSSTTPSPSVPSSNAPVSSFSSRHNTPSRVSSPAPRIYSRRGQSPRAFSAFPRATIPYPKVPMREIPPAIKTPPASSSSMPPTDPMMWSLSDLLVYPYSPPADSASADASDCIPPDYKNSYSYEAMAKAHWNALNLKPSAMALSFAQNQAVPYEPSPPPMTLADSTGTAAMPPLDSTFFGILDPDHMSMSRDPRGSIDSPAPFQNSASASGPTTWMYNGQYPFDTSA